MNELKARQYQRTAIAAAVAGVAMSMGRRKRKRLLSPGRKPWW